MSSGQPHDPLQAYIDELLIDSQLGDAVLSSERMKRDDAALKLAAGSNVAPLASAVRPVRAAVVRPYAEPIRTINLRMPLPPVAPAPVSETVAAPVEAPVVTSVPVAPVVETTANMEVQARAVPEPLVAAPPLVEELSPANAQTAADFATMAPPAAWLSNGRPQWAQQPFECLIFKVGGLQLAAPLVELGSIYPLEESALTEIFGQTQWFLGLLPVKEYNVRTMDTALVVMPERYAAQMRDGYRYVVSLFGSDWGLAVDAVVGTILLDPERVRWRGERSKRPWLAGTLIDQMCALFDIAQLAWLFHNQDRKRAAK